MPLSDTSTNAYPAWAFRREDETSDDLFYAEPRLVVHVDDHAVQAISGYLGRVLPRDGVILDLMSSWRSHLPRDMEMQSVVGLGLNAVEMAENPQLDRSSTTSTRTPACPSTTTPLTPPWSPCPFSTWSRLWRCSPR